MPAHQNHSRNEAIHRALGWMHHNVLLLLVGCYALSAVAAGPGLAIRNLSLQTLEGESVRVPMLLIALVLFCAAALIRWREAVQIFEKPGVILASLLGVWLGPAFVVVAIGTVMPTLFLSGTTSGVMVGLALVAAMPVANSSVGWAQTAGGNTAMGLALVVLSILLSPIATPQVLTLMGFVLSNAATDSIDRVVTDFSGWRFIVWVILPSLAGMAFATIAGESRIAKVGPWLRTLSIISILLLNYANASLAMPRLKQQETLASLVLPVALSAVLVVAGTALAWLLARVFGVPRATRTALMFSLSMKHTGLALVLAGELLGDQPRVLLVIMLSTILQHVGAGVVDRLFGLASENESAAAG